MAGDDNGFLKNEANNIEITSATIISAAAADKLIAAAV